jgi:hypothetical protein
MGARSAVLHGIEDLGDSVVHQQVGRVAGVVREGLDGHQIA